MPSGAKRRDVRREWLVGGAVGLVVLAVVAFGVWRVDRGRRPAVCSALDAGVLGVEGVRWDNEVTATGGSWYSVLTDGAVNVNPDHQVELAAAVADDDAGFARLVDRLDDEDAAAATRLRNLVLDPTPAAERRVDPDPQAVERQARPDIEADVSRLAAITMRTCGNAP